MNNILVFGASGQLGQCLEEIATRQKIENIHFLSREEGNIVDEQLLSSVFEDCHPSFVINCAAYTAVDKAEDERSAAAAINEIGVKNLAIRCAAIDATLIHISTDFVFAGDKPRPLNELDVTLPIGVYGQTKLGGETVVIQNLKKYFIIRTGWLYSEFANNFVKTMLRLGAERDELKIIADQVGTPTYAMDLAAAIFKVIESKSINYGVYHYSNEGVASWFDFARAVFDISSTTVNAIPVKTEEYVTKATRPAYSVLDKSKIKQEFNLSIPYWRDSLTTCIAKLRNN